MYDFVHIPKTGGTWFRQFIKNNSEYNIQTKIFHIAKVYDSVNPVLFSVRDPIDRFLSATRMRWLNVRFDDIRNHVDYFIENNEQEMTALYQPITLYLGDIDTYKEHEHNIAHVFDFHSLAKSVTSVFPEANSIAQTKINNTEQSPYYNIRENQLSSAQVDWLKDFFSEDYKLYEYIQSRPYYITQP
jgi:hypothetical protein